MADDEAIKYSADDEDDEGGFDSANKFSGTPDVQVAWLLGPIAESGNVGDFESLVETYPCVFEDMAARNVNTPLHVAAMAGHLDLVKAIMDLKPRLVERLDRDGLSPLHRAVGAGQVEIAEELLSRDPGLYKLRDCHGRTALHCGAAHGKDRVVEALIEFASSRSPDPAEDGMEEVTDRGETALHLAVKNKHKVAFEILIRKLDQPLRICYEEWLDGTCQPEMSLLFIDEPVDTHDVITRQLLIQFLNKSRNSRTEHLKMIRDRKNYEKKLRRRRRDKVLYDMADKAGNTVFQLAHSNHMHKSIQPSKYNVDTSMWNEHLNTFSSIYEHLNTFSSIYLIAGVFIFAAILFQHESYMIGVLLPLLFIIT